MPKDYVPAHLRRLVFERARGCCEYCRSQEKYAPQRFSIEHITPKSMGGPTTELNLALSCQGCNSHKTNKTSARDPLTGLETSLFNPREQTWGEHFTWGGDYTTVEGLSPTGRATVWALKLNRDGLVNIRWALCSILEHPPAEPEPN